MKRSPQNKMLDNVFSCVSRSIASHACHMVLGTAAEHGWYGRRHVGVPQASSTEKAASTSSCICMWPWHRVGSPRSELLLSIDLLHPTALWLRHPRRPGSDPPPVLLLASFCPKSRQNQNRPMVLVCPSVCQMSPDLITFHFPLVRI
jgi:hypothetical protein